MTERYRRAYSRDMEKLLPCGCHKVSDQGEVFSSMHQYSKKGVMGLITETNGAWKKLAGTIGASGYRQVLIHGRTIRVNRLVAQNFIPNPFAYPESQHKNGVRADNRSSNLKWGIPLHNAADRENHGNSIHGSKSPNAKLNESKVGRILKLRSRGKTLQALADKFQVSKKLVLLITQRKIWKHVKIEEK